MMKQHKRVFLDFAYAAVILVPAFALNLALLQWFRIPSVTPMIFVLGVFLIAWRTQGYFWGIVSSLASVMAVNYAFTYPYWAFNLICPEWLASAVVMLMVSIMTSTMTSQIKRQEQMKAEHLKTELITNVSHDIKTPLTSIVNYVDLLKKEDIPSPEAREYIAVLDRQSHRLKKLTEDLVEASKASSGVLNVDLQPTDVNVLFSQIEGEYQERLAACQMTLVTQPPAPGTVIRADSRLLSRVMDNLVSNICKYALPSTRVYVVSTLSREAVTISFKNVSRDELNISPDELMERFVRGDASRHTEGSGLGLSIARSLVQLQGGRFDLAIDADLFRADITFPLSESAAS